jgi:hypothetical protein
MALGNIYIKTRPLKFAFLVNPNKKVDILKAMQVSSFLWGGFLNPIIPYFERMPKIFKKDSYGYTSKKLIQNYIKLYDPDIIVVSGSLTIDEKFKALFPDIQFIRIDEILKDAKETGMPRFGLGLFEVLNKYYYDEFKFISKNPPKIIFPKINAKNRLFLTAILGCLDNNIQKPLLERFGKLLQIQQPSISSANYMTYFKSNNIFPRRIGALYLGDVLKQDHEYSQAIILINQESIIDILDYWNLRANGWQIIPVLYSNPLDEEAKKNIAEFVNDFYKVMRFSHNVFSKTTIIKGRSIGDAVFQKFCQEVSIIVGRGVNELNPKVVCQHWMPRMWIEWAEKSDHLSCCEIVARNKRLRFRNIPEEIELEALAPKIIQKKVFRYSERIFANEISYNFYGTTRLIAEVIPRGLTDFGATYSMWRFEIRSAKNCITYLSKEAEATLFFKLPNPREVFVKWFKQSGYATKESYAGLIAEQMFQKIGGEYGIIGTILKKGFIEILSKLANDKSMNYAAFLGEIKKLKNVFQYGFSENDFLKSIIEKDILEVGFEVQCPVCTQHNWYHLNKLNYELECQKCLSNFKTHAENPKEIKFAYKAKGTFSLPSNSYGAYSVLLTHYFFSGTLHFPTTPVFGILVNIDNEDIDIDYAVFAKQMKHGFEESLTIFGECKTFNSFEQTDVDRMKTLGEKFSGSILLFSCLKEALNTKERKMLAALVKSNNKKKKLNRPFNRIMILTGHELRDYNRPPESWPENLKAQNPSIDYKRVYDIDSICDATQKIHLGL